MSLLSGAWGWLEPDTLDVLTLNTRPAQLENTEHASSLTLLRLFSTGTWNDYTGRCCMHCRAAPACSMLRMASTRRASALLLCSMQGTAAACRRCRQPSK